MRDPSTHRFPSYIAPFLALFVAGVGALVSACGSEDNPNPTGGGTTTTGTGSTTSGSGGSGGSGGATSGSGGAGGDGVGGGGTGGSGGTADLNCPPEATGPVPPLKLTQVTDGLTAPVFVTGASGDESRLYVVEQVGTIRIIKDGVLLPDPFLDVSGEIAFGGERGLLGLAFHPEYAKNGRFFINYTAPEGGPAGQTVIAEYARSADADKAEPAVKQVLFTVPQPYVNHNGGMVVFGKDGYLYIGMGDGGSGGDPQGNGQKLTSKLGKILRIDVDNYPTPAPGNLPVNEGSDPDIWDWGVRNPWRFSFDRCTGDMYMADVGQDVWEEVNVEKAGDGQKNYGWNTMEGTHCFSPKQNCDKTGLTMPVTEYDHAFGKSITGGYVYRGTKIPDLVGTYLYGDYTSNQVKSLVWKDGALVSEATLTDDLASTAEIEYLSSFGEDAAGELYVLSYNGGKVFRIEAE